MPGIIAKGLHYSHFGGTSHGGVDVRHTGFGFFFLNLDFFLFAFFLHFRSFDGGTVNLGQGDGAIFVHHKGSNGGERLAGLSVLRDFPSLR